MGFCIISNIRRKLALILVKFEMLKNNLSPGVIFGSGYWGVLLDAHDADGELHDIHVTMDDVTHSISGVLFGDVWLCSGQSNMQMPLQQVNI